MVAWVLKKNLLWIERETGHRVFLKGASFEVSILGVSF